MRWDERDKSKTKCVKQHLTRGGLGFVLTSGQNALVALHLFPVSLRARG